MFRNLEVGSCHLASRKQMQILTSIFALVFVAGCGLLYGMQVKQQAYDKLAADRQAIAGTNQDIAGRYTATLNSYNTTMDELKYVEAPTVIENYVPTLVQQLERMSAADHVKLTGVRPSAMIDPSAKGAGSKVSGSTDKTNAPYKTLPVSLTLEGTYNQLLTFIFHMTRFPKILSVQSIALTPKNGSGPASTNIASPLLVATIGLNAYVFDSQDTPADSTKSASLTDLNETSDQPNVLQKADIGKRTGGLVEPAAKPQQGAKGGPDGGQISIR
jgi:Tfp pilus assembly protein PilO